MGSKTTRGAVIYTRVSTGEQAEHGTSLAGQLDACRSKALSLGLPIACECQDAGISGGLLLSRAGLQAALAAIRQGRADTLICANLSRFSRDAEHQHALKREIEAAGGRVAFCDMDFDDTPEGDLAFGIMGNFAEYEKAVIKARTMRGKRRRAEEGQQPQRSRPPFGYHIVTNAEVDCGLYPPEMRGHYVIDEGKAPVARRLFAAYHRGASLGDLCKALNAEVVPTPGNGRRWLPATVRFLLMNPAYKGEPVSGRQKCHTDESRLSQVHKLTGRPITSPVTRRLSPEAARLTLSAPVLVDADVWEAVQARLTQGSHRAGSPRQIRRLSGLTYCPHCGGRAGTKYQQANGKNYRYLTCRRRLNARGAADRPCVGDVYPASEVDRAVLLAVRKAWESPASLAAALSVYRRSLPHPGGVPESGEEVRAIDAALDGLRREEMGLIQAQVAGIRAGASPDAYAELFADLAARRKDLEGRRRELTRASRRRPEGSRKPEGEAQAAENPLTRAALSEAWELFNDPEVPESAQRDVLMKIVERVICQRGGADVIFRPGLTGGDGGEGPGDGDVPAGPSNCSDGAGGVVG